LNRVKQFIFIVMPDKFSNTTNQLLNTSKSISTILSKIKFGLNWQQQWMVDPIYSRKPQYFHHEY
jgi:hypothetical protein